MKVERIMMEYANYGLPTIEKKLNEKLNIRLLFNTFEWRDGTFLFKKIKRIGGNLFTLEGDFRRQDFCFRPKWYQYIKIYPYVYGKKIINFIKMMIIDLVKMIIC